MARAVGLDIGTSHVKLVELGGTARALKVQRCVIREVPPPPPPVPRADGDPAQTQEPEADPDAPLVALLREIFDELKLPKDDVCASHDAGTTIFREIMVPFTDEEQIQKVVAFEAEGHLHSHKIEDVIVNWVKTGESKDGSRLTIFASPKSGVAEQVTMLRKAGVDPASMDLDATALFTACDAAGLFAERPNVLLFDIGARSTSLILVSRGKPLVLRSFLVGTGQVEKRVQKELEVPAIEARQRARLPAGPRADDLFVPASALTPVPETEKSLATLRADAVAEQRRGFVGKIHREAYRSLATLQAEDSPVAILVSGGGSLLPGIQEALAERFGLPVEPLDLTGRFDWKDKGQDPVATAALTPVAVGLGLRMMGHDPLGIELLKDEFAPTNTFEVVKTALAVAVTLLFVTLLGLAFGAKLRRDAEMRRYSFAAGKADALVREAELAYLRQVDNLSEADAKKAWQRWLASLPQDETRAQRYMSRLRQRHTTLESELGLASNIPPIPSALEFWLEVIRAMNKIPREEYCGQGSTGPDRCWLRITRMDITARSATVKVEVADTAVLDRIRNQLDSSEALKRRARVKTRVAEPQSVTTTREGYFSGGFEFRFEDE
jgi:type IV pilus assembly protein PilM